MIKITGDENIPFVRRAFASLGEVTVLPGRAISNADLIDSDVLLVRSVTAVNQQLLAGTAVKFVATATSGTNHIDRNYLQQCGIGFADAHGSNALSVTQYVLSAISFWSLNINKPFHQLSIGIIGCGQVGSRLKHCCELLGMQVLICDPPLAETTADEDQTQWSDMAAVLNCDVISIHVPLSLNGKHATANLLNQQRIEQIKPGSLLINTSRGEVIDEDALLARQLRPADLNLVLDVWQHEPDINLALLAHTLIGTAHIAGYSFDGKIRGTEMIYHACCRFLQREPTWSVDDIDLADNPAPKIKLTTNEQLPKALLVAYNIAADSQRLKQLLTNNKSPNQYFDHLRKHYPIRREWLL